MVLASVGVGGLLLADAALRLRADRAAGRAGLAERAALLVTMQADALSVPLWNLDNDLMDAALGALAQDADFARAEIVRPDGAVMRRLAGPALDRSSGQIEVARDVTYVDHGRRRVLGRLRVALRADRLEGALLREEERRATPLIVLLGAVLITLHVAFRTLNRPLDLLAGALGRLAAGEQDVPIPGLHRDDEIGRVARGLQVFKTTMFQLARTQGEYRAIFDHAALGVYCMDPTGRFTSVNAALLAITGDTDINALQASLMAPGDDALYVDPHRPAALRRMRHDQDGYEGQVSELRRADGTSIWVTQTSRYVRDAAGNLLGHVGTIEDVTERHRRLDEERLRIRAAVESAGDAILIADVDGTPLFANRAFADILGYDLASLRDRGGIVPLLRDAASGLRVAQAIRGGSCRIEAELLARAGRAVPMAIRVSPISGERGDVVGTIVICTDLSDRRAAEAQIAHMAQHDSLTGLPNRVAFGVRLEAAIDASVPVAVLCLDLDRFKEINETLGHAAGDVILQQAAARIAASLGAGDVAARVGADEFIILQHCIPSSTYAGQEADALVSVLMRELSRPYALGCGEVVIGASIGIALCPQDCSDVEGLLRFGALALYEAKAAGRGTARRFSPEMDRALQQRSALERDLRRAIGEAALDVHFQPQCRLATGAMVGAEALLRWTHPERGPISPAEFIPIAEETGLIGPLGEWVLNTACRVAASWPQKLRVAVNISPAQFRTGDLVGQVRAALAASTLDPGRLELEITEGVMLYDTEATLGILAALKGLGVRLAMDDFGTGYSSLSYLRRMPIDKIKIDQSFIRELGREPAATALVRSIIGIGRGLGIEANAEGVETEEQALLLGQEGCHEVQGWYYGRPCPAAVFAAGLLGPRSQAA